MEFKEVKNDWFEYVPEWNGNRNLDEDQQISCEIKYMLQEDLDRFADDIAEEERPGRKKKNCQEIYSKLWFPFWFY